MKTRNKGRAPVADSRGSTQGLIQLIDCAIVEGAELRRPLFVFLLRLARLALLEREDLSFQDLHLTGPEDAK